jgi:uncharacterized Zn finger protein (UPF0148 family)
MIKNCPECKKDFETENGRIIFCDVCKEEHRKQVMRNACKRWRENNKDYKQVYKTRMKNEKPKNPIPYVQNTDKIEVIRAKRKQTEIMRRYHGL